MAMPARPERSRSALPLRQLSRFCYLINPDMVFGTHRPDTVMRNTMIAAECAAFWHLLGLSFSFPNWPESHDVRHRFSLLASFSWQASCSLFSPWTVGIALGLRRRELRYRWFQPSPAQIGRRHRFQQAP